MEFGELPVDVVSDFLSFPRCELFGLAARAGALLEVGDAGPQCVERSADRLDRGGQHDELIAGWARPRNHSKRGRQRFEQLRGISHIARAGA